jgi:hypothetical protein
MGENHARYSMTPIRRVFAAKPGLENAKRLALGRASLD